MIANLNVFEKVQISLSYRLLCPDECAVRLGLFFFSFFHTTCRISWKKEQTHKNINMPKQPVNVWKARHRASPGYDLQVSDSDFVWRRVDRLHRWERLGENSEQTECWRRERRFCRFGTSWSCLTSALLNLALCGFRSSMANGRPAGDTSPSQSCQRFPKSNTELTQLNKELYSDMTLNGKY